MNIASEIATHLLQIKAIRLNPQNPFTWASGIQSPIYCDNRIALSYPKIRTYIIDSMAQASEKFESFNVIAGVATAGIAHGALLAHKMDLPFVYVRSKAKAHGRQNMIEGDLKAGQKVLVIEDLISTGGSALQAVDALKAVGAEVVGVQAIFSYGFESAKTAFVAANCPFTTLSNYEALIEIAVQQQYIGEEQLSTLKDWRMDPKNWASKSTKL